MSVKTLDRLQVSYFRTALDAGFRVEKRAGGGGVVYGIPVFRAGTFKDSWGDQHTWEPEHLERMVFHFNLLRDRGILPNVPQRDQHKSLFGGGGTVVGYVDDLRVEGQDASGNSLLVADLDFTEPDALEKVERGTWRSRSAEIGFYETNDEAMYWPVFMGVAWVDLPAVEGLFSKNDSSKDDGSYTPIHDDEEGAVSHAKKHSQGGGTPPPDPSAGNPEGQGQGAPSPGSSSSEPGDEAGAGGSDGEEQQGSGEGAGEQAGNGSSDHGAPAAPTAGTTVSAGAGGASPAGHQFSINGQPTTDFAAVQRHIDNLETVLAESREQARKDFVSELASSGRIAATQVEQMEEHALSLTDEQYESFATMWSSAPQAPLFAHHGQQTSTEPGDDTASEVETLRERVKMHKRSGASEEKVKQTESYKRLMELTDNKG